MDIIMIMMLFFVIILIAIIAVLAVTNRIIFKMAVRNFTRRKLQSLIVVCGLMIGTAIISSSLVVQDTMVYMSDCSYVYMRFCSLKLLLSHYRPPQRLFKYLKIVLT